MAWILAVALIAVLAFAWIVVRWFFRGKPRPEPQPVTPVVPQESKEAQRIKRRLAELTTEERNSIEALREQAQTTLPFDRFAILCLVISGYAEREIADLPKITLRDEIISVDMVNLILDLEPVLNISISDDDVERMLTFADAVRFIESKTANTNA